MDIDFIDEDGWQAVQLRAENGNKAQDCTTLNDRSNVRSIVDSGQPMQAAGHHPGGRDEELVQVQPSHHSLKEQQSALDIRSPQCPFCCAAIRADVERTRPPLQRALVA